MHQQITLEVEKLRRLQIEMFTQSTANNFLGFMLITVISEAVIIVAVILIIQEDSMRLHESEIMNFGKIFYTKWVKETTENEELNGIPIIDFTFHEGRNNKFIEPLEMISINKFKIADKNTTTLPLWAVCMQLAFTALIALTISHAMLCWNFTSQPVPLILLDFCMLEKEMYENHCKQYLREEYPLTISNDLQTITRQVEENYNLYLSALDDKRQKLKLAVLPVGISYLLLLLVIFSSVLNSLLRNFIQKQNSGTLLHLLLIYSVSLYSNYLIKNHDLFINFYIFFITT
ncbi:unnamed protein product [Thelazia callipaeda]|uniref:Anoctamin n=1 Tax=Thelazia callipaeda TaxID=103827 RepID=A0A0N5CR81_THECL|nr:unnamed protein product [Thelazia callipaeda]